MQQKSLELEARVADLEFKLSFQEDVIEQLNQVVTNQSIELSKLWEANKLMKKELESAQSQSLAGEGLNPSNERPPHY